MRDRLNIRIDGELLAAVREIAKKKGTTVTAVIEAQLRYFLIVNSKRNMDDHDVEQI
jgi:hypothetical protein